jgi:thioesterase domain-containing protein
LLSSRRRGGVDGRRPNEGDDVALDQFVDLTDHFTPIALAFRCSTYRVPVSLIMADRTWPEMPVDYGWSHYVTGPIVSRRVRGDHFNMFDPAMGDTLGRAVADLLRRTDVSPRNG